MNINYILPSEQRDRAVKLLVQEINNGCTGETLKNLIEVAHILNQTEPQESRDWVNRLDEIDQDCVHRWEELLGREFKDLDEYKRTDARIDAMILEYNTREYFFGEFPELIPLCASEVREKMRCQRQANLFECAKQWVYDHVDTNDMYEVVCAFRNCGMTRTEIKYELLTEFCFDEDQETMCKLENALNLICGEE